MNFYKISKRSFFTEQWAIRTGVQLVPDEKVFGVRAAVSSGYEHSARTDDFTGGNEQVDIAANARGTVSEERLSQRDALQRDDGNTAAVKKAQQTGEFLGEKLIAQRVGHICGFEAGLNVVRDVGKAELAQVAIDKRINLVSVGSVEEQ